MITAVVLTKNEERNIERCIRSLSWCDEMVVVDDFSVDKTIQIIKNLKVKNQNYHRKSGIPLRRDNSKLKIYKRNQNGDFAGQRNFGLLKAKGEWVLYIDSDEVVSPQLSDEIKQVIRISKIKNQKSKIGYIIPRKDYFLGRWLKYGETANVKLLRLAKKNAGRWKGKVHETWEIAGKIGELENPLLHYPHTSIASFLAKINNYTDIVAQCWKEEGRRVSVWQIIIFPIGKFIQNYIFRLGFLDGIPGLIMSIMMSFHSFLARGKLWFKLHK